MPSEGPGRRFDTIATKQTSHGAPAVELNHAGVAAKSSQIAPGVPSVANAALAQVIAVNEDFVIMLDGVHTIDITFMPNGAAAGNPLWINPADNALHLATSSGYVKYGLIDSIDTVLGRFEVNLTQRSSF